TYGRGFWILDDMAPLRQLGAAAAASQPILFAPSPALRVHNNLNADTPFPPEVAHEPNPPAGAILYYYLPRPVQQLSISILDAQGRSLLRTLRSSHDPELEAFQAAPQTVPDYWKQALHPLPTIAGMHRVVWDLRYPLPGQPRLSLPMTAIDHDTAPSPRGPMVPPGRYLVQLTLDGQTFTQPLTVAPDPRAAPGSAAALAALTTLQRQVLDALQAAAATTAAAATAPRAQLLRLLNLLESPADATPTGAQQATYLRACRELKQVLAGANLRGSRDVCAMDKPSP
ncbi:MAG: hypothetical protein ACRD1E_13190, partial [Terriglobales bacterium]